MTITEFDLPAEALQGAQDQGCDLSMLEALKNIPLPMEMTITVDASGTGGTATMTIDASSIPGNEGGSSTPTIVHLHHQRQHADLPGPGGVGGDEHHDRHGRPERQTPW